MRTNLATDLETLIAKLSHASPETPSAERRLRQVVALLCAALDTMNMLAIEEARPAA